MLFEKDFAHFAPCDIITALEPLIKPGRVAKLRKAIGSRLPSVELASEDPADIYNALALVRTAEAFGIESMHIVTQKRKKPTGQTITQGARRWVDLHYFEETPAFLESLKSRELLLIGASPDATLTLSQIPVDRPLCVLLGNEHQGLSQRALEACDHLYQIPMYGMSQSLNLSVAGALSLFEITRRRREHIGKDGEYEGKSAEERLADYLIRAFGRRRALGVLRRQGI